MVTEKMRDSPCPLCRDSDFYNAKHLICKCSFFSKPRTILNNILCTNFGQSFYDFPQNIYSPPNAGAKSVIDNFLREVNLAEESVISQCKTNLKDNPSSGIGKIINLSDSEGICRRTIIKNYNSASKKFLLGPSEYSDWPDTDSEIDLFNFGDPDSIMIIPKEYALKFNPLTSISNLKILFLLPKVGYHCAKDIDELESIVLSGRLNRCPFNGRIARRYISVLGRGSNAARQGVT